MVNNANLASLPQPQELLQIMWTLTATAQGAFTVQSFEFNDVNVTVPQTQFSLSSETPVLSLPEDDTSVAIKFQDQIYNLP